ncbi:hypothetical protein AZE42_10772 [Rhizopogon vesiculosus]|uniref:Methylenetetrahydrofolate dehydrogenase n=1 Tax=Rhizopogon vesiculosus TaxID=180088 RepID=A0A1J8QFE7_9AGAM|nr:hypothetical protein AZE42_10772 [Rhizopogon vesiculosus]
MAPDAAGKGLLLKADPIADAFHAEVKDALAASHRVPTLIGILATDASPSRFYAEFTRKQCEGLGVRFILKEVGSAVKQKEGEADEARSNGEGAEEAIIEANEDDDVDGIMVYYPIFGGRQDHYLQQIVSPLKDVEGLNSKFHYNLYHNIRFITPASLTSTLPSTKVTQPVIDDIPPPGTVKSIIPCTPLGVVKCLEYIGVYNNILTYGDRAYGKTVTVINRSEVVGRPLAALLANDGARVFSVDLDTIQEYTKRPRSSNATSARQYLPHHTSHPCTLSLEECLAISDAVISAVPSASYKVKTEWLKEGCVCVNVAADKNFEKDVRDKASIYIPAVGKVTILMLLRNLLRLSCYKDVSAPSGSEDSVLVQ